MKGINVFHHLKKLITLFYYLMLISFKIIESNSKTFDNNNESQLQSQYSTINKLNKESFVTQSLIVDGNITTTKLISDSIEISEIVKIKEQTYTNSTISSLIITENLITDFIRSSDGELVIQGNVVLINEIESENLKIIFDQKGNSFSSDDVKHWIIINHDDFESQDSLKDWSDKRVNICSKEKIRKGKYQNQNIDNEISSLTTNHFLGGHCNFAHEEVIKEYKNLPKHSRIKISANFHFIDDWKGEFGYLKVDDKIVWSKSNHSKKNEGVSIPSFCGSYFSDLMSQNIEVIIPHQKSSFKLSFGSNIKNNPCNQSFGIDDVIIYVK